MSVTRGREAAFFFSNYRIRVLRFLYGTLLSAYFFCVILSYFGNCFVILKNEHSGMITINKSEKVGTT